jgi:2-polyprenyl-3-methyl-5-hydroxy-6-metoxy-1,4-benzoquinol methylase
MSPAAYVEVAQVQSTHWWYVARRSILRNQLRALALPRDAEILEIGSGTGANLDLLAEFGRVLGLEMADDAIRMAAQRAGATTSSITLRQGRCPEDLPALAQRFDLICLFDVLEHIDEDELSLARLRQMLKPGGRLMLTVPAYPWMWSPHDLHVHHRRRYTRRSLLTRCSRAGLVVTRMSHFNTLLFPLALAERIYEKLSGRRTSATMTPAAPVNDFFTRVFALERLLMAHVSLPFGLSLFVLAGPRTDA